jgi:hypothetical protein
MVNNNSGYFCLSLRHCAISGEARPSASTPAAPASSIFSKVCSTAPATESYRITSIPAPSGKLLYTSNERLRFSIISRSPGLMSMGMVSVSPRFCQLHLKRQLNFHTHMKRTFGADEVRNGRLTFRINKCSGCDGNMAEGGSDIKSTIPDVSRSSSISPSAISPG